jgi:phosphoserine phosphatase
MSSGARNLFATGGPQARAQLAAWLGARPESVNARTDRYRWSDPSSARQADVRARAAELGLDCALFSSNARLANLRLAAFDMDSTLITIECVDEIAAFAGKRAEVTAITEASMRGEITNFRDSLTRRVALLAGLEASVLERVYEERLRLSEGAEVLIGELAQAGVKTLLVSGGFTFFTERLKARLKLDFAHGNTLEIERGRLTGRLLGPILDAAAKAQLLRATCAELGCEMAQAVAVGDGANDLQMLAGAGVSVAFHAKPIVAAAAQASIAHGGLDVMLDWFGAPDG